MSSCRTMDDVDGPAGVMIARASIWTLHSTVTSVEIAAEAAWVAVRLIWTQKLVIFNGQDWNIAVTINS